MDKKLAEILVCPMCHGKLHFVAKKQLLLCQFDRVSYALDEGIPVLLPERATSLTAVEMEQLRNQGE